MSLWAIKKPGKKSDDDCPVNRIASMKATRGGGGWEGMVGNGYDMVLISVGASSVPPTPGRIFQLYLNRKGGALQ